jgi:hypothetical protein
VPVYWLLVLVPTIIKSSLLVPLAVPLTVTTLAVSTRELGVICAKTPAGAEGGGVPAVTGGVEAPGIVTINGAPVSEKFRA